MNRDESNINRSGTQMSQNVNKSIAHIFKGAIVMTEDEKERILIDYESKNPREIAEKIITQNNNIVLTVNDIYTKSVDINENMNREIMLMDANLGKIKLNIQKGGAVSGDPFFGELDKKITELAASKSNNDNDSKKSKDEIDRIEKKRKDHIDDLRKISSEKKVWLDQLNEDELRDLTYNSNLNNSPNHDYEYKIILLVFEGIFLEKVQENIDKALSIAGENFGWGCMNEEKEEKRKLQSEALLREKCAAFSHLEQEHEEENWRREEDIKKITLDKERSVIREEWRRLFKKFWAPKDLILLEENRKNKIKEDKNNNNEPNYELYVKTTKKIIFELFKKICFNSWHFKNIFLSGEDFILLEYLKKYLLGLSDRNISSNKEEEEALGIIMNLLKNLQDQADLLTIEESERLNVLYRTKEKNISIGEAFKEIKDIKILNNKRTLKRVEVSGLNSIFLPAMLTIRTILFMTIANRRIKSYTEIIETQKKEMGKKKAQNSEIDGQVKLLEDVKKRMGAEKALVQVDKRDKISTSPDNVDAETEYKKSQTAIAEIKKSMNQLKQLKNDLENINNNLIKSIARSLVKPENKNISLIKEVAKNLVKPNL